MSSSGFLQSFRGSQRRQRQVKLVVIYLFAAVMILFALFPVVWILSASLNPGNTLATQTMIPRNASLENFRMLLTDPAYRQSYPFARWLFNSVKLAGLTTLCSIAIKTTFRGSFPSWPARPSTC